MSSGHGTNPGETRRAGDVATTIEMPSRGPSMDGRIAGDFHLEAVHPDEHIHSGHEVVRDRKTGQHYKKVPQWSLAHKLGGDSNPTTNPKHAPATKFSLAHSFEPGKSAAAGGGGSRASSVGGTKTPPTSLSTSQVGLSVADVSALMERLRSVVREEVSSAHRGHTEHMEKVIADLPTTAYDDKDVITSSKDSGESVSKDGTARKIMDPVEAERGVIDGDSDADEYEFPNPWAKIRYQFREPFAEFLGCVILMTFGDGINVQALFSSVYDPSSPKGNYLSVSFGWGIAVAMAVYVCGGISGHINPAVTISLALFRGFPWKKVPGYIFAQISGATLGALMIYGLYVNPIREVDPGQTQTTAEYFTTFPAEFITTPSTRISGFYNEVYATAILLIVILAVNDGSNSPPPDGMAPIVLLWLITGIGATLGWQTAYAVNPARDLGPRIALSIVGYRGLWTFDAAYWAYTPLLGPLVGGPLGCFIYDAMIYTGSESPLNRPWKWSSIRWRPTSKEKIPAGLNKGDHQA